MADRPLGAGGSLAVGSGPAQAGCLPWFVSEPKTWPVCWSVVGGWLLVAVLWQAAWGSLFLGRASFLWLKTNRAAPNGSVRYQGFQVRGLSPRTDRPGAVFALALARLASFFFLLVSPHGREGEPGASALYLVAESVYLGSVLSVLGSAVLADTRGLHMALAAGCLGVLGSALSGARLGWLVTPGVLGLLWIGARVQSWVQRVPECAEESVPAEHASLQHTGQTRFVRCALAVAALCVVYACGAAVWREDYSFALRVGAALGAGGLLQQVWLQPDLWVGTGGGRVPGSNLYYVQDKEEEEEGEPPLGKAEGVSIPPPSAGPLAGAASS